MSYGYSEVVKADQLVLTAAQFIVEHNSRDKFYDFYELNAELGKGSFGVVQKCTHLVSRQMRAVKILDKDRFDHAYLVRIKYEINILKNLNHPNIVKLHEVFEDG